MITTAVTDTAAAQTITLRTITGDELFTATRMTAEGLRAWRWVLHGLETEHVLCSKVSGWHPRGYVVADQDGRHVGVVIEGGGRVHAEWYDPSREDYFYAGAGSRLAHGVNAVRGQQVWAQRHPWNPAPVARTLAA
jgi:hypothetical protein